MAPTTARVRSRSRSRPPPPGLLSTPHDGRSRTSQQVAGAAPGTARPRSRSWSGPVPPPPPPPPPAANGGGLNWNLVGSRRRYAIGLLTILVLLCAWGWQVTNNVRLYMDAPPPLYLGKLILTLYRRTGAHAAKLGIPLLASRPSTIIRTWRHSSAFRNVTGTSHILWASLRNTTRR